MDNIIQSALNNIKNRATQLFQPAEQAIGQGFSNLGSFVHNEIPQLPSQVLSQPNIPVPPSLGPVPRQVANVPVLGGVAQFGRNFVNQIPSSIQSSNNLNNVQRQLLSGQNPNVTGPQLLGEGANAAQGPLMFLGGSGVKQVAQNVGQGFGPALLNGVTTGMKVGGGFGLLSGLSQNKNAPDIQTQLVRSVPSVATGVLGGAAFGGVTAAGGYGLNKILTRPLSAQQADIQQALDSGKISPQEAQSLGYKPLPSPTEVSPLSQAQTTPQESGGGVGSGTIKTIGANGEKSELPVLPNPIANQQPTSQDIASALKSGNITQDEANQLSGNPRGFIQTLSSSENPQVKQAVSELPQTYQSLPNKDAMANAQAFIDKQGVENAHQYVLSDVPASAEKTATGELLMKQYADAGDMPKFKEIADSMTSQATSQGQAIQILSSWSKLSPRAVLNVANSEAESAKVTLSDDFQKQIVQRASDIQGMAEGSPERVQATQNLLKDIAAQIPLGKGDLFKSYRFQNMLSNPVTLGKIGYSGLFNTLVTHPVDLFAKATVEGAKSLMDSDYQRTVSYSDIPQWYKNVFIGMPDAWAAASEGFSNNYVDQRAFQEGQSGESTINQLRQANTPGALNFFPKLHSFIYNYFQSIVGGAEQARLMANGVPEEEATQQAQALADSLTLRSKLGANPDGTAAAVKAVDSLGNMVSNMADKPGIGWMQSWIAPFMRVSTNWTKLAVEHSPLALPDTAIQSLSGNSAYDSAFGKAIVGSIVAGFGAKLAMDGHVTLAAPTDPKENELFYASGRKPYSVLTPSGWVPMQYFGPFAISIMLPQAMKDAMGGVNAPKDAFTKAVGAITTVTKMVVATTPLPALSQFMDVLNGSATVNPATVAAGLAGQVIPLDSLTRYVATIVDPIYRKATTFTQKIESGIPGLSQNLPAYTTPLGQPETRNVTNYVAPYAIGQPNSLFEPAYKSRQVMLQSNAIVNQANKDIQAGNTPSIDGSQEVSPSIYKLPNGKYAYQITDVNGNTTIANAKDLTTAQKAVNKSNFASSDQGAQLIDGTAYIKDDAGTITTINKVDLNPGSGGTSLTDLKQQETAEKLAITLVQKSQIFNPKSQLSQQQAFQMISGAGGDPTKAYWGAVAALPAKQQAEYVAAYLRNPQNGDIGTGVTTLTQNGVLSSGVTSSMYQAGLISADEANALKQLIKGVPIVQSGGAVGVGGGTVGGTGGTVGGLSGGKNSLSSNPMAYGAKRVMTQAKAGAFRSRKYHVGKAPKPKMVKVKQTRNKLAQVRVAGANIKPPKLAQIKTKGIKTTSLKSSSKAVV